MARVGRWLRAVRIAQVVPPAVAIAQWALYLWMALDPLTGSWCPFNPDTSYTLATARSWVHGHPLRLNPGDPPSTLLSDLLSPLFFAPGHFLGFSSPSSFVFWAYLVGLGLALAATWALWRFFSRYTPTVAPHATFLCMIFPGIFGNILATNFGFLFVFFWAAMASLDSFRRFIVFAVLASLMRPEGILLYLFLVAMYATSNGGRRVWRFVPGLLPLLIPPLIYYQLTGGFAPQGVAPQNILNYYGRVDALHIAMASATDHVKGVLLGLFPSGNPIGFHGSSWIGVLPPLLLPGAAVGLRVARPRWLIMIGAAVMLFTFADSFPAFSGIHWHRHLHVFTPFLIGFGLLGARMVCGTRVWACRTVEGFFFLVIFLQLIGSLAENRRAVEDIAVDKAAVDQIAARWPGSLIMDGSGKAVYWGDNRVRWFVLSPQVDPELGRLVRRFGRLTELGEVIQRRLPDVWLDYGESGTLNTWLRSVSDSITTVWAGARHIQIRGIRHDALAASPPHPGFADELDVGDPLSEHAHGYQWHDDLLMPVGALLHSDGAVTDGGRPRMTWERFAMHVPQNGALTARYRAHYDGFDLKGKQGEVSLGLDSVRIMIVAQGDTVFQETLPPSAGFLELTVPLPMDGPVQFEVSGLFHSFHYWTVAESLESRGGVANAPSDGVP